MPPQIERELELRRHGYRVSIISPDYFVPFPDGTALTGKIRSAIRARSRSSRPADGEAYTEFDTHFDRAPQWVPDPHRGRKDGPAVLEQKGDAGRDRAGNGEGESDDHPGDRSLAKAMARRSNTVHEADPRM
jgi:phytoene dehydrogenase-like protein